MKCLRRAVAAAIDPEVFAFLQSNRQVPAAGDDVVRFPNPHDVDGESDDADCPEEDMS